MVCMTSREVALKAYTPCTTREEVLDPLQKSTTDTLSHEKSEYCVWAGELKSLLEVNEYNGTSPMT